MRIIPLLGFLLIFIALGCIGAQKSANSTFGSITKPIAGTLEGDERTFVYDLGSDASSAVKRTMVSEADSPNDAHNVYGTVDLRIKDCLRLNDTYYAALCLDSAALYLNDSSLCEKEVRNRMPICYAKFAIKNSDASYCELTNASSFQDSCKREIAIQTGDASLCVYDDSERGGAEKAGMCKSIAASKKLVGKAECKADLVSAVLVDSGYFGDAMLWLEKNHPGEQVLSWWDYGSSLDCMGMRSVISNKDLTDPTITQVADLFVSGNETRLAGFMRARGVKYVMLDSELLYGGDALGGKFGALNYLSCVYENKAMVADYPGQSKCESDNYWETVFISDKQCDVSPLKKGFTAYKMYYDTFNTAADGSYTVSDTIYQPYYTSECITPTNPNTISYCKNNVKSVPTYCIANTTISGGETVYAPFSFNRTSSDGDLMLTRASLGPTIDIDSTYHFGTVTETTLFFTHDLIWPFNGTLTEGYPDRTAPFYDSVLYKGIILGSMEGFKEVYANPSGSVKVFELSE